MSLEFLEIRPRFKKQSTDSIEVLLTDLQSLFDTKQNEIEGSIVHHHATVKIPHDQLHFWSPQLSLSFEASEGKTLIRGLYGPNPNVWLLFMFLFFFMGFVALLAFFYNIAHIPLGDAMTFSKTSPIFTAIFAWIFLHEKLPRIGWLAIFIGFIGIVFITQPTGLMFSKTDLLGILSGS